MNPRLLLVLLFGLAILIALTAFLFTRENPDTELTREECEHSFLADEDAAVVRPALDAELFPSHEQADREPVLAQNIEEIPAKPLGVIHGIVLDVDGLLVPQARVIATLTKVKSELLPFIDRPSFETFTDREGVFRFTGISEGYYLMTATSGNKTGYARAWIKGLSNRSKKSLPNHEIHLIAGGTIQGKVLQNSIPKAGIEVWAYHYKIGSISSLSGPDGSFRFKGLEEGLYEVSASLSWDDERPDTCTRRRVILPDARFVEANLRFGDCVLQGTAHVLGIPREGVEVSLFVGGGYNEKHIGYSASTVTGKAGHYMIDGFTPGKYRLMAKYDIEEKELNLGKYEQIKSGIQILDLHLGSTGTGEVLGYVYENNIAMKDVDIHLYNKDAGFWFNTTSDENGFYRFDKLPEGKTFINAKYRPKGIGRDFTRSISIEMAGGALEREDIRFQVGKGVIHGSVKRNGKPLPRGSVHIYHESKEDRLGGSYSFRIRNGSFRVEGIPAGWYRVSIPKSHLRSRTVEVLDGRETRADFDYTAPTACIRGKLSLPPGSEEKHFRVFLVAGDCPNGEDGSTGMDSTGWTCVGYGYAGPTGKFYIDRLHPGTYKIVACEISEEYIIPRSESKQVTLREDETTEVELSILP
jgi:hypothetical protein